MTTLRKEIKHLDPCKEATDWLGLRRNPQKAWDECPRGDCESVMLRVGEVFWNAANGIHLTVDTATADGFQVTISSGDLAVFADGFESGDLSAW